MTHENKRSRVTAPGARKGSETKNAVITPSIHYSDPVVNTQNSFYNDLLARLAELERRGAIIDARLAELDVFYTADLDAETEQVR